MARWFAAALSLALVCAPPAMADDLADFGGAKIVYKWFPNSKAGLGDYADFKMATEALKEATDAERKEAEAQLRNAQAKMPPAWTMTYYVEPYRLKAVLEAPTSPRGKKMGQDKVMIVRMDTEEKWAGFYHVSDKKNRKAYRFHFRLLEANSANKRVKVNIGQFPKRDRVNQTSCTRYMMLGGAVLGSRLDRKAKNAVQVFAERARLLMGGFRGEVLWLVTDATSELPFIGDISPPSGLSFGGIPPTVRKLGFILAEIENVKGGFEAAGSAIDWSIPEGYELKDKGFPKK